MRVWGIHYINGLAGAFFAVFMVIADAAWGAPSVLLQNRTADCPILFGDELAPPGECFAKIYWSYGDMKMGSVVVASNGSTVIPLSQPGFLDAGVGLLTPAPDFIEG